MLINKLLIAAMFAVFLMAGNLEAAADPERGKELAMDCAGCHGDDGLGDEDIPRISGLDSAYIEAQLTAFKSGERVDEDEMMLDYVADLSEDEMVDLAAYFSSRPAE